MKAGPRCWRCGEKLRDKAQPDRRGIVVLRPRQPSGVLVCPNGCQEKEATDASPSS